LAATMGAEAALAVYRGSLKQVMDVVEHVAADECAAPYLALSDESGSSSESSSHELGVEPGADGGWCVLEQRGDGLGMRMSGVFRDLFSRGHDAALLLGADSPGLPAEYVSQGLDWLRAPGGRSRGAGRMVLGPALDGGYYLVGLDRTAWTEHGASLEEVLVSCPMGSAGALRHTEAGARTLGLAHLLLPLWLDVDTESDLRVSAPLLAGEPGRGEPLTVLRELYLHVTDRCSGTCLHCYNRASAGGGEAGGGTDRTDVLSRELSTRRWEMVVAEAAQLGAESFVFIGGDPFARHDLLHLVEHITGGYGARVRVFFSRGLSRRETEALAAAGRGLLTPLISMDGPPSVNDALRGAGSSEETLASVRSCLSSGLRPVINTVLLRPTLPWLPELARTVAAAGVTRLHLILPHRRGGLAQLPHLVPTGSELLEAFQALAEAADRCGVQVDNLAAWQARFAAPRDLCSAGCTMLAVDPCGRVYACPITCGDPEFVAGSLADETTGVDGAGPLERIWRGSPALQLLRHSHAREKTGCAGCDVVDACGGDCWVQGHYAARADCRPAGYQAEFPYCGLVRPVLRGLRGGGRHTAAPHRMRDDPLTPFDCI
jgi:radical SAM protein with 4Fe4S-binding SPASM domain